MTERILQIVPAAAGWRQVTRVFTDRDDLESMPNESLYFEAPIMCFALVEVDDGGPELYRAVRAVCPTDWPQVIEVDQEHDASDVIAYLAPGERADHLVREEAIIAIRAKRAELERRLAIPLDE